MTPHRIVISPAPQVCRAVSPQIAQALGTTPDRVAQVLRDGGTLARALTPERAAKLAEVLCSKGLKARAEPDTNASFMLKRHLADSGRDALQLAYVAVQTQRRRRRSGIASMLRRRDRG